MIFDQYMTTNDFLDCSNQTLKTIEFHIRDGRGRYINLHNAHITFSIIFTKHGMHQINYIEIQYVNKFISVIYR